MQSFIKLKPGLTAFYLKNVESVMKNLDFRSVLDFQCRNRELMGGCDHKIITYLHGCSGKIIIILHTVHFRFFFLRKYDLSSFFFNRERNDGYMGGSGCVHLIKKNRHPNLSRRGLRAWVEGCIV